METLQKAFSKCQRLQAITPRLCGVLNLFAAVITVLSFIYVAISTTALNLCGGLAMFTIVIAVTGAGAHVVFTAWVTRTAVVYSRWPWQPDAVDNSKVRSVEPSSGTATPGQTQKGPMRRLAGHSKSVRSTTKAVLITPGPLEDGRGGYMRVPEVPSVDTEGPALITVTGKPQRPSPHRPGHHSPSSIDGKAGGVSPEELTAKLELVARRLHAGTVARVALTCLVVLSILIVWAGAVLHLWMDTAVMRPELGSMPLPGLSFPVSISYSEEGVPHIISRASQAGQGGELDVWYAQGAVHARDRLWQIEFQRRVSSGTLSDLVGAPGLDMDRLFRLLGFTEAAQRDAEELKANIETQAAFAALERYCQGVNDWVQVGTGLPTGQAKPQDVGDWARDYDSGYVPLEMRLLGVDSWQPYTPAQALAWAKVTAWGLAGNLDAELQRYDLLVNRKLSPGRIDQLRPPFNTTRFPTVLSAADLAGQADVQQQPPSSRPKLLPRHVEEAVKALHEGVGSPGNGKEQRSSQPSMDGLAALVRAQETVAQAIETASARAGLYSSASPLAAVVGPRAPVHVRWAAGLLDLTLWAGDKVTAVTGLGGGAECQAARGAASQPTSLLPRLNPNLRARSGVSRPGASNNWVVHGNYTDTGLPIVSNDPHLQLLAPSLWYLNHVQCLADGIDVVGASFIGSPGVVIGRNAKVAWAVTNTGVDVQDTYILTTDSTGQSYYWNGSYVPFDIRREVITVKGEQEVTMVVRVSRYGPVITDYGVYSGYGQAPLALRWAQLDPTIPDTLMAGVYGLQRAHDWGSFRTALSYWTGPSQNFMYADVEGHIGYQMPGWIPVRNISGGHTGAYPVPGTGPEYDWLGSHPFDSLPRTYDPPEGFIVSANNQVTPPGYPVFLTADWDETTGYRAARIKQMILRQLNTTGHVSVDDMSSIQADTVSGFARDILAKGGPADRISAADFSSLQGRGLRDRLVAWATASPEGPDLALRSREATLWARLYTLLAQLGTASTGTSYWSNAEYLLTIFEKDGQAGGSDPACAARGLTCAGALAHMFDQVALQAGLQPDGSSQGVDDGWGTSPALHPVHMEHEILTGTLLGCVADRFVQHGGDDFTVNVGGWDLGSPTMEQTHGPSYRQVVDLADSGPGGWGPLSNVSRRDPSSPPRSVFVQPMGQRGDPLGPGYDSMTRLWADVGPGRGYVDMSTRIPQGAETLVLVPQS